MDATAVPSSLVATLSGRAADPTVQGPDGDAWLRSLPRLIAEACARWAVTLDPSWVRHGECAVVVPVTRDDHVQAALTVTWPHAEARHEHLALRAWAGRGAVRLLAADPASWTVLVERLDPDRSLAHSPITVACETIGTLLHQLDRPASPQFTGLHEVVRPTIHHPGVPRRLCERATRLTTELLTDTPSRLVHTDLHYENVLATMPDDARAWVAIDPKPLAADPAFGVWPVLHNRWGEVVAASSVRRALQYRLSVVCEAAGLDEERAAGWSLVRSVRHAVWLAETFPGADLTPYITIAKAMEPE